MQYGQKTWEQLEEIHRFGYSNETIFNDFVDTILFALLSLTDNFRENIIEKLKQNKLTGKYEDQYLQLVGKYKENKNRESGKRPIDYFTKAWALLQLETKEFQQDLIGEIYMINISHGEHGQFFTPTQITDMMAQITGVSGKTVCDPCVGSGRFFISMAKVNKDLYFTGVDISPICAKMTVLNMWLFDLNADIYEGDSLTMQMSQVWRIRKGGFIYHDLVKSMPVVQQAKIQQTLFDLEEQKKTA